MRFVAIVALAPLAALSAAVGPLPPSEYADTEVSTNIPIVVNFDEMSRLDITLSLVPSPSNGVEIAIGTDANDDGVLSLDETDRTFGYNCGSWFQRDSLRDLVKDWGDGEQRDDATSRVERTIVLKRKELDPAWDMVKVVRRGVAEVGEVVLVERRKFGLLLFVR